MCTRWQCQQNLASSRCYCHCEARPRRPMQQQRAIYNNHKSPCKSHLKLLRAVYNSRRIKGKRENLRRNKSPTVQTVCTQHVSCDRGQRHTQLEHCLIHDPAMTNNHLRIANLMLRGLHAARVTLSFIVSHAQMQLSSREYWENQPCLALVLLQDFFL